jgi:hypothetical protein
VSNLAVITGLTVQVVCFSVLDRRRFGTWITPFVALACPYTAVVLLVAATASVLGFAPLYGKSVLVWMAGLLLLWLAGRFVGLTTYGNSISANAPAIEPPPRTTEAAMHHFSVIVACVLVPLLSCSLFLAQRATGGWMRIDTAEFKAAYSSGIFGHVLMLSIPVLILLVGTVRRGASVGVWGLIALLVLFLFVGGVKGVILQPVIAGALYRVFTGRLRLSPRLGLVVVSATLLAFCLVYLFTNAVADANVLSDSGFYLFLFRHYFFYLFSGVLAFGEALRLNVGSVGGHALMVFAPFVNIHRVLTHSGPLITMGSTHAMGMNFDLTTDAIGQASNVYTLFGTLYLYLDIYTAALYVLVMGLLLYGLLVLVRRQASPWLLVIYCFLCAQLVFGFFELYFWLFNFIEITLYCLVFVAISRFLPDRAQESLGRAR